MERISLEHLYRIASAEGEGLGTAYEYLAKWNFLERIFNEIGYNRHVLIGGLPEKYGLSMDFVLFAMRYDSHITVIDERDDALHRFKNALKIFDTRPNVCVIKVKDLSEFELIGMGKDESDHKKDDGRYALSLCSEVLQRLPGESREDYVDRVLDLSERAVIFVPNRDNRAHARWSGLNALSIDEIARCCGGHLVASGYIDMPPFPPGLKKSRIYAPWSSTKNRLLMKMLEIWCASEKIFPNDVKRKVAHIVYAYLRSD